MSILEQTVFIKNIPPFDILDKNQIEQISQNLDILYFKKYEVIQQNKTNPEKLYFIIKGIVQEKDEDDIVSLYSNNEVFDAKSLIENWSRNTFIAIEETICYSLDKSIFLKILHENKKFESYFFQTISQKLNSITANGKDSELINILVAKVQDAYLHKALIVPFDTSIYQAASKIKQEKVPSLLLQDKEKNIYIVTDSDFRQKVILNRMNYDDSVGKISSKDVVCIDENDFLFNAQLIMTKHNIKKLIVKNKQNGIVGILDQISISTYFTTRTFLIVNQIEKAVSIEELKDISHSLIRIVRSLHTKGVKIDFISKLINQLNQKIMNKLFLLTAPKELIEKSCLVVMGSEGRNEQILKTDQDNALILSDDCPILESDLNEFAQNYTKHLIEFGFPPCKGNIMISNPYWCKKHKDFKNQIFSWLSNQRSDDFMNLAIFYDSFVVCGDEKLCNSLKEYIFKVCSDSLSFYAHFANIITSFDVPLGFFDGFIFDNNTENLKKIDIKKGGIFILVQGIRSLSLEYKILKTNTIDRIKKLHKLNIFDEEFAQELIEAFNFLLSIKLKSNLAKLDKGKNIDNFISLDDLNMLEKDLLKDSFKIVNKLKKKLEFHYKLNYV